MDEKRSKVRLEEATHNFEALLSERIKRPDVPFFEQNTSHLVIGLPLTVSGELSRFRGKKARMLSQTIAAFLALS